MTKPDRAYKNFEAALVQFLQEHMPWPYEDVPRHSDEANATAWEVAKTVGPQLWAELHL